MFTLDKYQRDCLTLKTDTQDESLKVSTRSVKPKFKILPLRLSN